MDSTNGVWKMKRNIRKILLFALLALAACVLLCACKQNEKSNEELIQQAIEVYLASLKEHDIQKTRALVDGNTVIYDANENPETLRAVYYTIDDCRLESIDYPDSDDWSQVTVTAHYVIVYSDDYIPIGSREKGENKIKERFTLEKREGQYTITSVEPIFG